jgi:hypothetical protein
VTDQVVVRRAIAVLLRAAAVDVEREADPRLAALAAGPRLEEALSLLREMLPHRTGAGGAHHR